MFKTLKNYLFVVDRAKYELVRQRANAFNSNYTGSNIIQDDIFHIIENYVLQHGMQLEIFRYPLGDADFCACTFISPYLEACLRDLSRYPFSEPA